MYDVIRDIHQWVEQNEPVVLATVASTWGSSPRKVGAKMAFTPSGKIAGSVSGGCVEGAVYEAGLHTLETHRMELLRFGVADETAFEVGLACGGKIEVFVQPLDQQIFQDVQNEMDALHSLVVGTVIEGPDNIAGRQLLFTELDSPAVEHPSNFEESVRKQAQETLSAGQSKSMPLNLNTGESARVFYDVILPPPTLIMVGGVHISIALATIAKALGYRTIIIDPRRAFGSQERFPHVDQLIQEWPQEALQHIHLTRSTAVVMLTHDPKIDDPALKIVFNSPAFYIGALGSRKTQDARRQRLLADGISSEQLDRIHGPVGIELGSETPEEIALSVMAEIVATSHGVDS